MDAGVLAEQVRQAVAEMVQQQTRVGIDIISDDEMSKIGFANYVKDQLTGFEGESNPTVAKMWWATRICACGCSGAMKACQGYLPRRRQKKRLFERHQQENREIKG